MKARPLTEAELRQYAHLGATGTAERCTWKNWRGRMLTRVRWSRVGDDGEVRHFSTSVGPANG